MNEYKGCDNCRKTEEELAAEAEQRRQAFINRYADQIRHDLCHLRFALQGEAREYVGRWPIDYGTDNTEWAHKIVEQIISDEQVTQ